MQTKPSDYDEWHGTARQPASQHAVVRCEHTRTQRVTLTISKSSRTSFSDSPWYFELRLDDDTLKNVVPHSVATAFAR